MNDISLIICQPHLIYGLKIDLPNQKMMPVKLAYFLTNNKYKKEKLSFAVKMLRKNQAGQWQTQDNNFAR